MEVASSNLVARSIVETHPYRSVSACGENCAGRVCFSSSERNNSSVRPHEGKLQPHIAAILLLISIFLFPYKTESRFGFERRLLRKAQIFASRHRRKSELAEANRRRRHSQVVRQGTANPRFSGSNPDGASIKGPEQKLRAFSFWPPPLPRQWCAGCACGIGCVGRWTEAGAPWVTRVKSATPNVRNRSTAADRQRKGGRGGGVARGASVVGQQTNGAPGTVRPTTCGERFRIANTSSVIQRKGRRGRRPLRWLRVGRCQRSRKVQFITPVTFYAASPVSLLHVGCTVLGAPRSRDHRGGIDASARVDRF